MKLAVILVIGVSSVLFAQEPQKKASVTAKFSEDALFTGARKLYVYSKEPLTNVQWKFIGITEWRNNMLESEKVDGLHVYVSETYLQMDPLYVVKGTKKDGTNFLDLLTVKDGSKGPEIDVTVYVEKPKASNDSGVIVQTEQKAAAVATIPYPNTLKFAQDNIGRTVGGGGCNSLAAGRHHIGTITNRGVVTGSIVPGSVIELLNYSISGPGGVTHYSNQHFAVVESYDPTTSNITILHQNWAGGYANGKYVRRDVLTLNTLYGTIYVRSGDRD